MDTIIQISVREVLGAFGAGMLWFAMCYGAMRICVWLCELIIKKFEKVKESKSDHV